MRDLRKPVKESVPVSVSFIKNKRTVRAEVIDVSKGGLCCIVAPENSVLFNQDDCITSLTLNTADAAIDIGSAHIRYCIPHDEEGVRIGLKTSFEHDLEEILEGCLASPRYIRDELSPDEAPLISDAPHDGGLDFLSFYNPSHDTGDLFYKTKLYYDQLYKPLTESKQWQFTHRVTALTKLDTNVVIFNPITQKEHEVTNFDTNSYLGLHLHPRVVKKAAKVVSEFGIGSASSQILFGTTCYHRELEDTIARFYGREATLLFNAGYVTNLATISTLVRKGDCIFGDALNHASIIDGCTFSGGDFYQYRHRDYAHLKKLLQEKRPKYKGALIVSDSIFSMDGDIADAGALVRLKKECNASLMLDEAHALGVIGKNGKGTEEHFTIPGAIDVIMGTFSKTNGTCGGYITGAKEMIEYLRVYARGFAFSTALPAYICAAVTESFKIIEREPERIARLWDNVDYFTKCIRDLGLVTLDTHSAIIPIIVGSESRLMNIGKELFAGGVKCGLVQFPATNKGEARLRFQISALHKRSELDKALALLENIGKKYCIRNKILQK